MEKFEQTIRYHPQVKLEEYNHPLPFTVNVNGQIDGVNPFKEVEVCPDLPDVDEDFKEKHCYMSKITLKDKRVPYPYTQAHKDELRRCKNDIYYFIQNYTYILSLDKGFIPFAMFQYQKNMIKVMKDNRFSIFLLPRQMGKAISGETNILTPNGFVKMKDLMIGDCVYDESGNKVNVINKTNAQLNRKCYKINFSHGESIIADENHDWVFFDSSMNKIITRNTKEMKDRLAINKKQGQSISIPLSKPIEFESKSVLIKPYDLGVWLGDGFSKTNSITCHIDDYNVYKDIMDVSTARFRKGSKTCVDFKFNSFNVFDLESLNLRNNKHIPLNYIFNSLHVRQELLRGLMDTDGSIEKNGVCRFYQSDERLANDFRLLLSTLGIKSTISKKTIKGCKDAYTVRFVCNEFDVVKLPRKLSRQYVNKNHQKNKRFYISSIEDVDSVPVFCIEVDNDSHLFLIGDTLIPTHNCSTYNTIITVRNKKTGVVETISIGEFYDRLKTKKPLN